MQRSKGPIFVLLVAVFSGCDTPPDPARDQFIADLTLRRMECNHEWREARRIPAGKQQTLNLGPVTPGAALRLGVFEGEPHGETATLRVYVGERHVRTFSTGRTPRWADYRVDLSPSNAEEICRLVVDAAKPLWVGPCELTQGDARPNVLIYLIDTLRLDHLGCYGYSRDTSPNLDTFARDSVLFTHLMPQSSWTKPSVASLLTSTYPNVHGAQDRPDVLREGLPSLAASLAEQGYETHGLITNTNILPLWGFGKDFHRFVDVDSADWVNCDDARVVERAIATLDLAAGRPWFLYVHTMGPHDPYEAPDGYDRKFVPESYAGLGVAGERQRFIDQYDGEIAYSDLQFGRMMQALKERRLYDNTLIVLLSDHGEEFWEHGDTCHGKSLYEEVLRVPLLIKLPGNAHAGERREDLVEAVDIAPTLLDSLGLPAVNGFQGKSFKGLIETGQATPRVGYASLVNLAHSIRTAKTTEQKYIRDVGAHWEAWFDLKSDPGEKNFHAAPGSDARRLKEHTGRMGLRGAEGLHILMTCGDAEHTVTGTLAGAGLGPFELHYYDWKGEARREGDAIRFRWLTVHPTDRARERDFWHTELAEQDNAHLQVAATMEADMSLSLEVDGHPAPPESVFLGAEGKHPTEARFTVKPAELLAGSDAYDPAGLPRAFGLYVWYVAPPEAIAEEDLDPKIRENLQALGYL